ncbi:MAG: ARMT1-like domain-containing protein [Candidatus Bathyarchaeia archaeon]
MKPRLECGICALKWTYERGLLEGAPPERLARELIEVIESTLSERSNLGEVNNLAVFKAYEVCGRKSEYFEPFKERCNENASRKLEEARNYIYGAKDGREMFERSLRIACAANVSPVTGPKIPYSFEEVSEVIAGSQKFAVDRKVFEVLSRSKRILYVPDNAGEIGFDGLLIQVLKDMGKEVTLFVKRDPFFDDATLEDAVYFGIEKIAQEIHQIPGFLALGQIGDKERKIVESVDLIICKGVGSYEALGEELLRVPVLFIFKVKCLPLSASLKTEVGKLQVRLEEPN